VSAAARPSAGGEAVGAPTPSTGANAVPWPGAASSWYAVFVLTVIYVLAFVDRTILSLMVGPIRADLGLTDTEISLLHGFAFAIFYTTLGIPIALLADRMNRRNIMAIGVAFWSLATAACGLARTFGHLFLARVGVGVGEAALSPSAYSFIADAFPPQKLSRAVAVYTVGAFAGSGVAFLIGGAVIGSVSTAGPVTVPLMGELQPWQLVFVLVGLPGVPMALWLLTIREPPRRKPSATGSLAAALRDVLRFMRGHWQVYASHFAGFSLIALVFNAGVAWLPAYLMRVHGLKPSGAGFWLGSILLVAGVAGVLTGGWLADRWQASGKSDGTMRVGVWSAMLALPFAASATLVPSLPLSLALITGFIFATTLPYGAAAAALQIVTPGPMRATASAIYLCILNLAGIGAGSALVALATDKVFGDDLAVGKSLALVCGITAPLAALIIAWGLPHFRHTVASLREAAAAGR
jgi:MFS family permease